MYFWIEVLFLDNVEFVTNVLAQHTAEVRCKHIQASVSALLFVKTAQQGTLLTESRCKVHTFLFADVKYRSVLSAFWKQFLIVLGSLFE